MPGNVCSSSFVERRRRDSSPLSSYSFYLLVAMVTINTLQNTGRPSNSYLSGYFKAISQREATSGSKRSPSRRQTRGHTGRPPAICGPIGTAQSKQRAAPLALLHSFTPLSSCAIVARPFADTSRGRWAPSSQTKASNYQKRALSVAIILNAAAPRVRARRRGVHHQHVFTISSLVVFVVLSGKIFDLGLNAASVSKMLIRPEGGFSPPPHLISIC